MFLTLEQVFGNMEIMFVSVALSIFEYLVMSFGGRKEGRKEGRTPEQADKDSPPFTCLHQATSSPTASTVRLLDIYSTSPAQSSSRILPSAVMA